MIRCVILLLLNPILMYGQWDFNPNFTSKSYYDSGKILSEIDSSKKMFRLVNRVSYIHKDYPVRVDLSITKQSDYDKTKKRIC